MKVLDADAVPEMPFIEILPKITVQLNSWEK